jgi:4-amino-4-deoxy-L-arabinose transferase-like glycosyltransferase
VQRGVIAAVILLLAAADLTVQSRSARIHVDEAWMLNRGFLAGPLYRAYLRTGTVSVHWSSTVWQPRKPPLGNVIIGLGLWLGDIPMPAKPYAYDYRHDQRWNVEHHINLPPPRALRAGRSLVPLFSAAATSAVFVLTAGAAGIGGGLAAAALFHFNPVVRFYGSRALSDMVMLSFSLWALWFLARCVAPAWDGPRCRLLRRTAVFGLLTGLAVATKQNGGLVGCAAVASFATWGIWSTTTLGMRCALTRTALATLVLAVSSYGLFVLVNPQLHAAPLARTLAQATAWKAKFREHQGRRPEQALRTVGARVQAVANVIAGRKFATLPIPYVTGLLALVGAILLVP